jgi:tRNA-dihydrouridine synthase B
MLDQTGCDAVMIGRGALGNPWIFSEVLGFINSGEIPKSPDYRQKIDMVVRHMDMLIKYKGERIGLMEMRKHVAWYIKGMRNATYIKEKIFKMTTTKDIFDLLNLYLTECQL